MQIWLATQTPFLIFAIVCVVTFGIQYRWLRKTGLARLPWLTWVFAVLLLGLGWHLSVLAAQRETRRIQSIGEDFARLYGAETEKRGHWKLPDNVAANDPLYLNLIETEITWKKLNPDVSDIYTLRKSPDGKNIFIVDSETDYNHNGKYDEEREQRTPVGEVYPEADDGLELAFRGQANFDFDPITDRWGTWVSAFVPLRDPSGRVEGVLGVDFDAHEFITEITNAKLRILGLLALLQLVLLGSSTLNTVLRVQIAERKKTEESLRFFGSAVEQANESIMITDAELDLPGPKIIFVNPAFSAMTGYSAEEAVGKTPRMLQGPRTERAVLDRLRQNLERGEVFAGEAVNYRKDGTAFDLEWQIAPVRHASGTVTHFVAIQRDITVRKQALEELNWKTAFLEAQVNSSIDGILVVDEQGRTLLQNQRLVELWNMPQHIADEKGDENRFRWVMNLVKNPGQFTEKVAYLYSHPDEISRDEIEFKDGMILDRYSAPVAGKAGKYYGRIWTFRDITGPKRAERALLENEGRMRLQTAALEATANAVTITDLKGTIEWVNGAFTRLTGYSAMEAVGQNPRILKSGQNSTSFYTEMWETITHGNVWKGELINRHKDGRFYHEEMTITPVPDADGTITHFVAVKQDITGRKQFEARLFQSQKMETVGKLAGGIAHEFNSILTAIIGQSELLLGDLPAGSPLVTTATEISKAAGRAATLTRQLLAYGRKQLLQPETLDLNRVIANMDGIFRLLMSDEVNFQVIPDPQLQMVNVDAGQVEQVIVNLVINAREAMPKGGKLTLETANVSFGPDSVGRFPELKPGDYVMLAITDTGTGMSADVQARVFEPFFTTKKVGQGTGLGLSACYGIVKQSGGHISVYSEPGRGTVFKIYLPQVRSPAMPPLPPPGSPGMPRGTETILWSRTIPPCGRWRRPC